LDAARAHLLQALQYCDRLTVTTTTTTATTITTTTTASPFLPLPLSGLGSAHVEERAYIQVRGAVC
jgi:hypothetical protein